MPESNFTLDGYNDKPKPCQEKTVKNRKCKGTVHPTWNANVGKCNKCGARTSWESLKYIDGIKEKKDAISR